MSTDPLACLGYNFKDLIKPPLKIYSERKLESSNMPLKRTCSVSPLTNELVAKFVKNMNLCGESTPTQQHRKLDRSVSEPADQKNTHNLQKVTNSSRYKTEICRSFDEQGSCRYAERCQFAHGVAEIRTLLRHHKYKTERCRTYHTNGICPYGMRCHFIHQDPKLLEFAAGQQNNRPKALSIGLGSSGELSPTTSTGSPTSSLTGFFAEESSRSPQSPTGFVQQQISQQDYRHGSPTGYMPNQALLDPSQYDLFELNSNLLNSNLLILDVGGYPEPAAPRMVNPNVTRYDNMLFEDVAPKERVPLFSRRGSP